MRKEKNTWTTLPNGARVKKEWIFDAAKNIYKVKKENNLWEEVKASELEKPTATETQKQLEEAIITLKKNGWTVEQQAVLPPRVYRVYRPRGFYPGTQGDMVEEAATEVFCDDLRLLEMAKQVASGAVGAASSHVRVESKAQSKPEPWQVDGSAKLRGSWAGLASYPGAVVYPSAAAVKTCIDPAADPLAPLQEKANNTYAVDTEEGVKLFPLYPEPSARRVIEAAIDKLKKIKKLNINSLYIMKEGEAWRVIYKVISDNLAPDLKQGKLIEVIIHKDSFNRTRRPLDEDASIPRDKDTNDYIILRVAYMLYKLYKLPTEDAKKVANTLITVISCDVKPFFTF